jgi:high-affinity nickel permease
LTTAGPRQTSDSQANSDLRKITRNAFFIGTIEILGLAGQKYNLNGGFWSFIQNFDIYKAGFVIVGIFVLTWTVALAI